MLTAIPTVMVEPFLKEYLGVDMVVGTEIEIQNGRATGFVCQPGIITGEKKVAVLREAFDQSPDIGLGDRSSDYPFMKLCKVGCIIHRVYMKDLSQKYRIDVLSFN